MSSIFRVYYLFRLWAAYKSWNFSGAKVPPPHAIKKYTILKYSRGLNVFIESGTYKGDMVFAMKDFFKEIHSIELNEALFLKAKDRFKPCSHIHIHHGDSGQLLPIILDKINEPILFWLDGHYSGGITAKGEKVTPILAELEAISKRPFKDVILIDDARLFNGEDDYPKMEELRGFISEIYDNVTFKVENDIIIISQI